MGAATTTYGLELITATNAVAVVALAAGSIRFNTGGGRRLVRGDLFSQL